MNLFLLAVIMRQVAVIMIAILGYGIYKAFTSKTITKKYTNFAISIYLALLTALIAGILTIWFKNPLTIQSDELILQILQTKYSLLPIEILIGIITLGFGLAVINPHTVFNSSLDNVKLAWFTLFFASMLGAIGYTMYEQQVQLYIPPQEGEIRGLPVAQPDLNEQFVTENVTEHTETVLYTNNQDITVSLGSKENLFDVSNTTTYKELLNILKSRSVRLSKGSVTREISTNNNAITKDTSGFLNRLTEHEQNTLPLQVKITKVSLITETITTSPKIRPSLVYKTKENKYFYVEYEIINKEEADSLRDSKDKDNESIDNLLKGSDKYDTTN